MIIFANEAINNNAKVLLDEIKVVSWRWSLRLKASPCLFYEWSWDPRDCLLISVMLFSFYWGLGVEVFSL